MVSIAKEPAAVVLSYLEERASAMELKRPGAPVAAGLSCIFGFADWKTSFAEVLESVVKAVETGGPKASAVRAGHASEAGAAGCGYSGSNMSRL